MILLAKLDRLAIGSILRSKLVFLVNVRPQHGIHRGCLPRDFDPVASVRTNILPSVWTLIMRAIKCL